MNRRTKNLKELTKIIRKFLDNHLDISSINCDLHYKEDDNDFIFEMRKD